MYQKACPKKTTAPDAGITAALAPHAARYYIPETLGPRQPFVHPPSSAAECTLDAFVADVHSQPTLFLDTPLPEPLSLPASALDHSAYGCPDFDAKAVAVEALYATPERETGHGFLPSLGSVWAGRSSSCGRRAATCPPCHGPTIFSRHRARHHEAARQLNVHRVVLQKNRMVLRIASVPSDALCQGHAVRWAQRSRFHADTSSGRRIPPRPLRIHCADLYLPLLVTVRRWRARAPWRSTNTDRWTVAACRRCQRMPMLLTFSVLQPSCHCCHTSRHSRMPR